jgi:hypothetical protein
MRTYSLERIELPEIGVLRYNITGLETNAETEPGLVAICQRLEADPQWTGVLFDHSQSQISYTVTEFNERVEYAIRNFPRRVKLAYVYNPSTLVISARTTKLLNAAGVNAQAFAHDEEALEFLKSRESWSRQA